jgi:hypothetical protein
LQIAFCQLITEFLGGILERMWGPFFGFPLEHAEAQYWLLLLLVKDHKIGKSILGNELFDAFLVNDVSLLTLFLCQITLDQELP